MADFRKAIQEGLDAGANAEAARFEIGEVVQALSDGVTAVTGGAVAIEQRGTKREIVRHIENVLTLGLNQKETTTVRYRALFAYRVENKSIDEELAEIELAATGFPVTLRSAGEEVTAYDREALEGALERLVRHPDIGRKLQRLAAVLKPPGA